MPPLKNSQSLESIPTHEFNNLTISPRPKSACSERYGITAEERPDHVVKKVMTERLEELDEKLKRVYDSTSFYTERRRISHVIMSIKHELEPLLRELITNVDGLTGKWKVHKGKDHTIHYRHHPTLASYELTVTLTTIAIGSLKQVDEILSVTHQKEQRYATLKPNPTASQTQFCQSIQHEIETIRKLKKHQVPHIASIERMNFVDEELYTMESCSQDLFDYIAKYWNPDITENPNNEPALSKNDYAYQTTLIALYLTESLKCMHAAGICHRDLKPENILLRRKKGLPLISDFGLAKKICDQKQDIGGTPGYVAPENLTYKQNELIDTPKSPIQPYSDMWSFGVVLYMLLRGENPFIEPEIMTKNSICKYRESLKDDYFDEYEFRLFELQNVIETAQDNLGNTPLETLTKKLISFDSKDRPTAQEAYNSIKKYFDTTYPNQQTSEPNQHLLNKKEKGIHVT